MIKRKTLKGFTLTELLVAMILFSIVVTASGMAVSSTMGLFFKETGRTVSSVYVDKACDYITKKIKYGENVEIISMPSYVPHTYDRYFDSDKDIVLYVGSSGGSSDGRKIYLVQNSISGTKSVLFESSGMDMILRCTPDSTKQSVELELDVTEKGNPNSKVFVKSAAVHRLNDHIGSFSTDFNGSSKDQNYYILIDID